MIADEGVRSMPYEGGGFREKAQKRYYSVMEKVARPLVSAGVSPNHITVAGMLLSLAAGIFLAAGAIFWGGMLLWASGLMDPIDGTVARLSGKVTRFGALFDSTLDRYSEFFIFFGLMFYFKSGRMLIVVMLALLGSIMVSYIKARAESLGQKEFRGLMQRPERIILLIVGTVLNAPINHYLLGDCQDCTLKATIVILAVLTNLTALQRLLSSRKELA
jgi:CDP-diacylglycerol--glycerol-3-phosphate 3-phosphatidyltransferase